MLTQRSALAFSLLHHCLVESTSENALHQGCSLSGCLQTDTRPSVLSPSTQTQLLGSIPAPAIWRRNKGPSPHPLPCCRGETGESWHPLGLGEERKMEEAAMFPPSGQQLLPLVLGVDETLHSFPRHMSRYSCKCQALDQALGTRE